MKWCRPILPFFEILTCQKKSRKEWFAFVTKLQYEHNMAPDNLELAQRFWASISGEDGYDVRNGRRAVDTFRTCALKSDDGLAAMLSAFRKLAEDCGEFPRSYLFDPMLENLIRFVSRNSDHPIHADATWLLETIDIHG